MHYAELRARLDDARSPVRALVEAAEAEADLGPLADALPFSPRVWDAWLGNALKMRGVKRIDAAPYATHPTRMALICHWVLPESERDDSAVLALLHDYLEEGDGFSPAALAAMRVRFPGEPLALRAAVVLSEPEIAYEQLGPAADLWQWRRVAYTVQARDAVRAGGGRAFANAALADKLDNLHDLGYIEHNRKLSKAKRAAKLAVRLAYFRHVGAALGGAAHPGMTRLLDEALTAREAELALPPGLVAAGAAELARRDGEKCREIQALVDGYHTRVGLGAAVTPERAASDPPA